MRVIYLIRHGEKAWANGKVPATAKNGKSEDPPLLFPKNDKYVAEISKLIEVDAKEFSDFSVEIICSPLLRTRQTMSILQETSEIFAKSPVNYNHLFGEYFGHMSKRNQIDVDVHDITSRLYPDLKLLPFETLEELDKRASDCYEFLLREKTNIAVIEKGLKLFLLELFP